MSARARSSARTLPETTDAVPNPPKNWADLLKPDYAGQIAFPSDPASSPMVALAVLSAGRALADPGQSAAVRGLDHFAAVAAAGNMAPVAGTPETVADGTTPILILSDAEALAGLVTFVGTPVNGGDECGSEAGQGAGDSNNSKCKEEN